MNESRLGKENIYKLFFAYSVPAVIGMVITGAQSIIDGIFLGRYAGLNAMAAVNIVIPFVQIINAVCFVVCIGAASKMGRLLGSEDNERAQSVFRTAAVFNTVISVVILIVGVSCARPISRLLGASDALIDQSSQYLLYFTCFTPVIVNMFLFGFSNRVIGKPNLYLFATGASVLVNILFNYIFIAKLHLGTKGAAIATGLSFLTAFIITIIPFLKKTSALNLYHGKIKFKEMIEVCLNGSSEAVVSLSTALMIYLFNRTLYSINGDDGIAAFTIISYVATFATLVMFGVSDGISPIFSYNYGSRQLDRVRKLLITALIFNLAVGTAIFLIVYFKSESLINMFTDNSPDNAAVVGIAAEGAKLYALNFIFIGLNIVASGFFTAIGKAGNSIIIALSRGIIWVVAGIFTLPLVFGINGVWLTIPFSEIITVFISTVLFVRLYNKYKKHMQ